MSFFADKNVFVTGATGLLGSATVERLLDEGATVTCLVRDSVPRSRAVEEGLLARANRVRGGLEDYELILRTLNEYEIDTVLHLGAQTIVGTAARSARSTFEANVRGTWNVMDACRELSGLVRRVVVASSDKAYGCHDALPYAEDAPLAGRYPYDVSKSCADLIALSYHHTFQVPVAITRCGNLFGPGDLNFNRIVPGTIRSVHRGECPIVRSDGKFLRDYFYVEDAVDAYLLLAERVSEQEGVAGEAFNFGNEKPVTVLELVDAVLRLMGREDLRPNVLNQASNEILEQYLDCGKARRSLGWAPRRSQDDALRETIAWYTAWLDGARRP